MAEGRDLHHSVGDRAQLVLKLLYLLFWQRCLRTWEAFLRSAVPSELRRRRKAAWGWEDGGTVVSTGSQWAGSGRDLGPEAAPSQVTFEVWMESLFPFPFTPTSTPQRVGQASEHYRKLSSAGAQLVSRLVGVWEVPGRPVITVSEQHIAAKPRGGNSEMETERRKLPGESGQSLQ